MDKFISKEMLELLNKMQDTLDRISGDLSSNTTEINRSLHRIESRQKGEPLLRLVKPSENEHI